MRCPHCETENRDDRGTCYHCSKDLTMLRLIINRAKHHFNNAVEFVEQERYVESLGELNNALDLDSRFEKALVLKGTILARLERFDEAREAWEAAIKINPQATRAQRYLSQIESAKSAVPLLRRVRFVIYGSVLAVVSALLILLFALGGASETRIDPVEKGLAALENGDLEQSWAIAQTIQKAAAQNLLEQSIQREISRQVDLAVGLAENGRYEEASDLLEDLEDKDQIRGLMETLTLGRDRIEQSFIRRMNELLEGVIVTPSQLNRLLRLRNGAEVVMPERIQGMLEGQQDHITTVIQEQVRKALIPAEAYLGDADQYVVVLESFSDAQRYLASIPEPFRQDTDDDLIEQYARVYAESLLKAAGEVAKAGNREQFQVYQQIVTQLPGTASELVAMFPEQEKYIDQRERDELAEMMGKAFKEEQWRRSLEAASALAIVNYVFTDEWTEKLDKARRELAIQSYYELMERWEELESEQLEGDMARQLSRLVQEARTGLPPRLALRAEENLGYAAARTYEAMGETALANLEWEWLEEHHPKSPYIVAEQ
jgi:tetratricopeptide (TPR) repeat protein